MASFQSQYGLRISRDLHGMKWREFAAFVSGFDSKTPLGRIVAIRAEDNPEVIRQFTPAQKKIRNEWRTRKAKEMPKKDVDTFLEAMKQAFINMAGGTDAKNKAEVS